MNNIYQTEPENIKLEDLVGFLHQHSRKSFARSIIGILSVVYFYAALISLIALQDNLYLENEIFFYAAIYLPLLTYIGLIVLIMKYTPIKMSGLAKKLQNKSLTLIWVYPEKHTVKLYGVITTAVNYKVTFKFYPMGTETISNYSISTEKWYSIIRNLFPTVVYGYSREIEQLNYDDKKAIYNAVVGKAPIASQGIGN